MFIENYGFEPVITVLKRESEINYEIMSQKLDIQLKNGINIDIFDVLLKYFISIYKPNLIFKDGVLINLGFEKCLYCDEDGWIKF